MSIIKFFEGIKFNFLNFFAYSIFIGYLVISMTIVIMDVHENSFIAAIEGRWNNLLLIVVTFFFGASVFNKYRDKQLDNVIESNKSKDETIKQLTGTGDGNGATK